MGWGLRPHSDEQDADLAACHVVDGEVLHVPGRCSYIQIVRWQGIIVCKRQRALAKIPCAGDYARTTTGLEPGATAFRTICSNGPASWAGFAIEPNLQGWIDLASYRHGAAGFPIPINFL